MAEKNRILYVLDFLWRNTDEDHPASTAELLSALAEAGVPAGRHTLARDIEQLREFGFDVICVKSSPNRYFIGSRLLELAELKLLTDAVESSRFIPEGKSGELVRRLYELASVHQAQELDRHLYVDGRVKSDNRTLLYTVDLLHRAIHSRRRVRFRYIEYTAEKKKIPKHGGYVYELSPYAMLWHDDRYYVLGYSEKHKGMAKFRVDRIDRAELTDTLSVKKPEGFDPAAYLKSVFSMYEGRLQSVRLKCTADMMKVILDRFGQDVRTMPCGDGCFLAEVTASAGRTFFGWVFGFGGKIRIAHPPSLVEEYRKALQNALEETKK